MDRKEIFSWLQAHFRQRPGNLVTSEMAGAYTEAAGLIIYDEPLMGVALADDPLFEHYKEPAVIGPWHKTPEEWLRGAKSVISMFFPFSERVRVSNRIPDAPSVEWLFGRIEGQEFMKGMLADLSAWLTSQGVRNCAPMLDPRFAVARGGSGALIGQPGVTKDTYASNWSERHAAYAAGLGTFSLTRGVITKRGMAGRFCSVVTDLPLVPDARPYTDPYEYCIRCGACARRCPAHAISLAEGKKQRPCAELLSMQKIKYNPRYGCGKCQTSVPCEYRIPVRGGGTERQSVHE